MLRAFVWGVLKAIPVVAFLAAGGTAMILSDKYFGGTGFVAAIVAYAVLAGGAINIIHYREQRRRDPIYQAPSLRIPKFVEGLLWTALAAAAAFGANLGWTYGIRWAWPYGHEFVISVALAMLVGMVGTLVTVLTAISNWKKRRR